MRIREENPFSAFEGMWHRTESTCIHERNVGEETYRYALIRLTMTPNRAQLSDERMMPAKEMSTHTKLVNLGGKNATGDLGSEKGGGVGQFSQM